jgi:sulfatase maturation enzyme AslB (radical SAM superfamily)
MENIVFSRSLLNKSLIIFFREALRITIRQPAQAISFFRSIAWFRKAAKIRENWKKKGYIIPPISIFSITNECNLSCPGCYNKSFHQAGGKELSDQKIRRIVSEAKELGVSFFVIAGGEPLMRPVLLEVMKNDSETIFLVFTNGTSIDDRLLLIFKKHKNIVPFLSLEGNQEETDNRRGEGTFLGLQSTMLQMRKMSLFFGLSLNTHPPRKVQMIGCLQKTRDQKSEISCKIIAHDIHPFLLLFRGMKMTWVVVFLLDEDLSISMLQAI